MLLAAKISLSCVTPQDLQVQVLSDNFKSLLITWVNSIFERFIHNLFITKTMPIYTNQTKCQNYLKCKCKRSRLHPIHAKAMNWFYAPSYKYLNQMIRIEELRVGNKVYFTEKQTEWKDR